MEDICLADGRCWVAVDAVTSYKELCYQPPLILLMGSERQGLMPEKQALCDRVVRIPMTGRFDSLNLGVATSIILYEVFYQQHRDVPSAGLPQDACRAEAAGERGENG